MRRCYAHQDFAEFIEAFKWVTSFCASRRTMRSSFVDFVLKRYRLRRGSPMPRRRLSIGVMYRLRRAGSGKRTLKPCSRRLAEFEPRGLRLCWVVDAVRQSRRANAV